MGTPDSGYRERVQSCPDESSSGVEIAAFAKVLVYCDFTIVLMVACEKFERDVLMGSVIGIRK